MYCYTASKAMTTTEEEKIARYVAAKRMFEEYGLEVSPRERLAPNYRNSYEAEYVLIVTDANGESFEYFTASDRWRPCKKRKDGRRPRIYSARSPVDFVERFLAV